MASDPQYPNEAAHAHAQTLKGPTPAKDRQRETMYRSHVAGQVHTRAERDALREALRELAVGPSSPQHPHSYQSCKVCLLVWCHGQAPEHRDDCLLKGTLDDLEQCPGCGDDLPESLGLIEDGMPLGCGCDGAWNADGDAFNPYPSHDDDCRACAEAELDDKIDADEYEAQQRETP